MNNDRPSTGSRSKSTSQPLVTDIDSTESSQDSSKRAVTKSSLKKSFNGGQLFPMFQRSNTSLTTRDLKRSSVESIGSMDGSTSSKQLSDNNNDREIAGPGLHALGFEHVYLQGYLGGPPLKKLGLEDLGS